MRLLTLRSRTLAGIVLLAGLIASSLTATLSAQEPSQPIYPLREGTEWIFEAGAFELSERVAGFDDIGGERCARIETRMNGRLIAAEHVAVRRDGVYRVAIAGDPVSPPLCFLKYPAPQGSQWMVQSKIQDQEVAGTFTLGTEVVDLPAGRYQAITAHGTNFEAAGKTLEFTYYFVPGIGKVRQLITVDGQTAELALKEFRAGK